MASPGLPEDITAGVTTGHVTDHEKIHDLLNEFDSAAQAQATGDLLVFQDGLIKRLPVGSDNQVLTADSTQPAGVKWAAVGLAGFVFGGTVYFTSSGTFTKADYPGLRAVMVHCQGGGGGGGGCAAADATRGASAGGGGGGGYVRKFILAEDLTDSVTVTVGAGGAGGSAGSNNGSPGGDSSFGAYAVAGGGGGGSGSGVTVGSAQNTPGTGGTAPTGDLRIRGDFGGYGLIVGGFGFGVGLLTGFGGGSFLGGSVRPGDNGQDGLAYGGGGSGGRIATGGEARAGGNGAPGIVIVELYF